LPDRLIARPNGFGFECEAIASVQGWFINSPPQELRNSSTLIKFSNELEIARLGAEEEKALKSFELVRRNGPRGTDRLYGIRARYRLPKIVESNDAEVQRKDQDFAEFTLG